MFTSPTGEWCVGAPQVLRCRGTAITARPPGEASVAFCCRRRGGGTAVFIQVERRCCVGDGVTQRYVVGAKLRYPPVVAQQRRRGWWPRATQDRRASLFEAGMLRGQRHEEFCRLARCEVERRRERRSSRSRNHNVRFRRQQRCSVGSRRCRAQYARSRGAPRAKAEEAGRQRRGGAQPAGARMQRRVGAREQWPAREGAACGAAAGSAQPEEITVVLFVTVKRLNQTQLHRRYGR